jgi:hypothetical protein
MRGITRPYCQAIETLDNSRTIGGIEFSYRFYILDGDNSDVENGTIGVGIYCPISTNQLRPHQNSEETNYFINATKCPLGGPPPVRQRGTIKRPHEVVPHGERR